MTADIESTSPMEFNVLLLGDRGVGKSTLVENFVHNCCELRTRLAPGVVLSQRTVDHEGNPIRIRLWDAQCFESIYNINFSSLSELDAVVLVFDTREVDSFVNLKKWYYVLENYVNPEVPRVFVASKMDSKLSNVFCGDLLDRAQQFSEDVQVSLYITSALQYRGVEETFAFIIDEIKKRRFPEDYAQPMSCDPQCVRGESFLHNTGTLTKGVKWVKSLFNSSNFLFCIGKWFKSTRKGGYCLQNSFKARNSCIRYIKTEFSAFCSIPNDYCGESCIDNFIKVED